MQQPPTTTSSVPGRCLRPLADEDDAARIVAICASAAAADAVDPLTTLEGVPTLAEQRTVVREALARGATDRWLLVEAGGEPVGYGRVLWWDESDGTRVYLHLGVVAPAWRGRAEVFEVSVRPGWRRRGLARALLARALNDLYERGVRMVRLHTREDNPNRAPDLYQHLGFRTVKRFPRYRKPL